MLQFIFNFSFSQNSQKFKVLKCFLWNSEKYEATMFKEINPDNLYDSIIIYKQKNNFKFVFSKDLKFFESLECNFKTKYKNFKGDLIFVEKNFKIVLKTFENSIFRLDLIKNNVLLITFICQKTEFQHLN